MNVLNLKIDQQTKKRLRSLRRKSLIECDDDFESYMIHSLFRSFVEEKSTTDQETGAVFNKAQHFSNLYTFEAANERFLTGHPTKTLATFLDDRDSIISSLVNGAKDGELYVKVVRVLPKAELFLFTALNHEEVLFNSIYDAALEEATKRRNVVDKQKLLVAKSFGHWGWFSSDHQNWDLSQAGFTNAADCPAKLLCYHGVHQILCGKLGEGMSWVKRSVDRLSMCSDEDVLKEIVYSVLAECHQRKGEHEMASHYENLCSSGPMTPTTSSTFRDVCQTDFMSTVDDNIFSLLANHLISLVNQEEGGPASDRPLFKLAVDLVAIMGHFYDRNGQLDIMNLTKECAQLLKHRGQRTHWFSAALQGFLAAFDINPAGLSTVVFEQLLPSNVDTMPKPSSLYTVHKYNVTKQLIESNLEAYQRLTDGSDGGRRVLDNLATKILFFSPVACILRRDVFTPALKSYEQVAGADFEDLASSYDKLGALLFFMDDYNGAEESFLQALRLREENSKDPVEMAFTLTNLGHAYFKMDNEAEGDKAFENALKLRKQMGAYDHADTAIIFHRLGENHMSRVNFTKALGACQDALELRMKYLGEHTLTALSLNESGRVYLQTGDYDSAKEAFHKARDMNGKLGDERNTAAYCQNLASAYYESGSYEDLHSARAFCQEALTIWQKLGEHVETANSLNTLGFIHFKLAEFPAAMDACQEASKHAKEPLGDHTRTAKLIHFAAYISHELKYAIEAFQEASRIRSNVLGDHKDTAASYHWLGVAQYDMGDLDDALGCLQTALRIRKQVLGDHPDTARSSKLLNHVYGALSAKVLDLD